MTDVRQLLMEANPVARVDVPEALRAELFAEVRRTPPARRARRWQWPLPTVLLALVTAGGVATAGGLVISELTRDQSAALATDPGIRGEDGPPTAYGAEIAAAAEAIVATTPYPPGTSEEMDWEQYGSGLGGSVSEMRGSLVGLIQFRAACKWREYWLASVAAGENGAADEAAQILAQVPEWSGIRGNSREGSSLIPRAQQVAQAAAARDVDTVTRLTRGDCRDQP